MKERPILFSGPMVRAILEGKKTQTRRVVRRPLAFGPSLSEDSLRRSRPMRRGPYEFMGTDDGVEISLKPYAFPGDRLWVRETWAWADGRYSIVPLVYRADGDAQPCDEGLWRPSIHMPREASRITLRVTEARVQRLQEISFGDIRAEGLPMLCDKHPGEHTACSYIRDGFVAGWDSINGKKAPWSSNPWVWAITFEQETTSRP